MRKMTEMQANDPKDKKVVRKRLRKEYGNRAPPQQRRSLSLYHGCTRPAHETVTTSAVNTVFSPHFLALQLTPKRRQYRQLDLVSTLSVTTRWREAILSHSNGLSEPVRRMLSGHDAKGDPAGDPHLAFLPLAFVSHKRADGHLLGIGLALPTDLSRNERSEALRAITAVRELKLGPLGVWIAERVTASQLQRNLRPEAWTAYPRGATHWSTVTPIVFDRHPKAKDEAQYQQEITGTIASSCTRIGLPEPREVIAMQVSAHFGAPPSFGFPRLQRKDGCERRHSHAILVFDEPVCGPILVGAGRFRGYGFCRPLGGEGDTKRRKPYEEVTK